MRCRSVCEHHHHVGKGVRTPTGTSHHAALPGASMERTQDTQRNKPRRAKAVPSPTVPCHHVHRSSCFRVVVETSVYGFTGSGYQVYGYRLLCHFATPPRSAVLPRSAALPNMRPMDLNVGFGLCPQLVHKSHRCLLTNTPIQAHMGAMVKAKEFGTR